MNKSNEIVEGIDKKSENHSCCCGSGHLHHEDSSANSVKGYQCLMKCEGDKTYKAPGTCPVCNMRLSPVK